MFEETNTETQNLQDVLNSITFMLRKKLTVSREIITVVNTCKVDLLCLKVTVLKQVEKYS